MTFRAPGRRAGLVAACVLPLLVLAAACSSSDSSAPANDSDASPDGPDTTSESGPGSDGGADTGPGPGELSPDYVDYDINAIISTGQSNSIGQGGTTILTPTPGPYNNVMFDTGVLSVSTCSENTGGCKMLETPTSMVPIHEGDTYFYPVETPATALANQVTKIALETFMFGSRAGTPSKHDVFVADDGRSGWTYWCLRKGSCNYQDPTEAKSFEETITEVQAAKAMATAKSLSFAVRAVTVVHGESDSDGYLSGHPEFPLDGTGGGTLADYGDAMVEWQRDMETGVTAITGQKTPVPLLIAQLSGWKAATTSPIPQMQLDAHTTKAPGKVVLVTPTYMFNVADDCLHYDSDGERWLGEYFAKAYARIVFQGQPWEPLRPASITRADTVITVKFLVPKPPLVFDTTAVSQAPDMGFNVVDSGGNALPISKVELSGTDSVNITLAAAPSGAITVRYAENQATPDPAAALPNYTVVEQTTCIGPGTQPLHAAGPRGNLHDSDNTPSQFSYNLANWAVAFSQTVN